MFVRPIGWLYLMNVLNKCYVYAGEQNVGTAGIGGTGQQPILAGSKPHEQNYFYWVFVLSYIHPGFSIVSLVSLLVTYHLITYKILD